MTGCRQNDTENSGMAKTISESDSGRYVGNNVMAKQIRIEYALRGKRKCTVHTAEKKTTIRQNSAQAAEKVWCRQLGNPAERGNRADR